jgi:hypothetical protein
VTPDAGDTVAKLFQGGVVSTDAEVSVVALEVPHEVMVLVVEGEVPVVAAPV